MAELKSHHRVRIKSQSLGNYLFSISYMHYNIKPIVFVLSIAEKPFSIKLNFDNLVDSLVDILEPCLNSSLDPYFSSVF